MIAFSVKQCPYCGDTEDRRAAICEVCHDKWASGYSPCDQCNRLCAPFTRDDEARCERCAFFAMLADARHERFMRRIAGLPPLVLGRAHAA